MDGKSHGFRDIVVHSKNLYRKDTQFEDIHIRIYNLVFELFIVFFIHRFSDQPQTQWRYIDHRKIEFRKNMLERSDVIQVSVCDEYPSDILFLFGEIIDVRYHIIYTMHFWGSKFDTCVYDDDIIFVFQNSTVDTYLFHTSQRDDPERNFIFFDQLGEILHSHLFYFVSVT